MKKKVWIFNHYATSMYGDEGGRHYEFSKQLLERGYEPTIFCANTFHNKEKALSTHGKKYLIDRSKPVPFIFIRTVSSVGNGVKRIGSMLIFYFNLLSTCKSIEKELEKPDIILASSVHPLTLVAGLKIAKKFNIPCVCEIRDLWPESFIHYGIVGKNNPILKLLYSGEKWLYKKADKIIFTMEGGKEYITEKKWDEAHDGPIKLSKVFHINNGVNLETFDYNKLEYEIVDPDLNNRKKFNVVYTGSIGKANHVEILIEVAKILRDSNVQFLIWGTGNKVDAIADKIRSLSLENIILKGRVEKKYVPNILSKSNLNIILGESNPLFKYGVSFNKLFEYLASGVPVFQTFKVGYSIIEKNNAGIELSENTPEEIARAILRFCNLEKDDYNKLGVNAKNVSENYDFKKLTDKLIDILE